VTEREGEGERERERIINYTGLQRSVTKSRVGESHRFCDAENESGRRIFPARQVSE